MPFIACPTIQQALLHMKQYYRLNYAAVDMLYTPMADMFTWRPMLLDNLGGSTNNRPATLSDACQIAR